ncbi:MAG: hypothetical protein LBE12_04420 [Planctomycetaceae bacterium]|nr:hypothetical protein [Planctomycetaceae bacterium]
MSQADYYPNGNNSACDTLNSQLSTLNSQLSTLNYPLNWSFLIFRFLL